MNPSEKSKFRIVSLCLAHCQRFHLLHIDQRKISGEALVSIASEVVELVDRRVSALDALNDSSPPPSSHDNQHPKQRKKRVRSFSGESQRT